MRKLLNTLYVTSPDSYLALDGENVVIRQQEQELRRVPLHNLEGIACFGYAGASPALMGACAERGIDLCFLTPNGRFQARVVGEVHGNVLLRIRQHEVFASEDASMNIARNMISGKLYNARWVLERATRDHALRLDVDRLKQASEAIRQLMQDGQRATDRDSLRGIEGKAATWYFAAFNELILQQKQEFAFKVRSRRPPLDRINALMSFCYTLLANECGSALEAVGLDPYIGFMHSRRPGRASLALDLMEELRPVFADRFVLSMINRREVAADDFVIKENGAVILKDDARKRVLTSWQTRKKEEIMHPYLGEKLPWGLVPFAQAMLLARYLRGDLDAYPPFLWK